MTMSEAFTLFLEDKSVNGVTDKTVSFYNDTAFKFVEYAGTKATLEEAALTINGYFLGLRDRELSDASIHTHWRAIKTFWRFVFTEGYVEKMPKLLKIKSPSKQVKPLSIHQVRRVLAHFDTSRFTGLRNQTIIRLMFDTGLRLSEVAGLDVQKIDLGQRLMCIMGKGRKERWVPFSDSTKKQLWTYFKRRANRVDDENGLFVTASGTRMTPRGIQIMFRRLAEELETENVRLSPHTIRHSFAMTYIESGGDPFSLQRILGHSSQQTTARYVTMARTNLMAQHEKYSPGDRI